MPAHRSPFRRLVVAGFGAAVLVAAIAARSPGLASAAPAVPTVRPSAAPAAAWLAGEVAAGGDQLSNVGQVDWGITADAVIALVAVDGSTDPVAGATFSNLLGHLASYVSWDDLGPQFAGVQLSGPTAKTLLAAEVAGQGASPAAATLEAQLRSLLVTSGPSSGRFADHNPYSPDTSNGFGQADAVLALARTAGGMPAPAVAFLVAQQCPGGGFRLTYSGSACSDPASADTDATAMAVQALLAVDRTPEVAAALASAVGWLESIQDPATGAFGGTGPTAAPNTNSAGLIAEALRGAGETAAADRAAAWIESLQLVAPAVDAGAIAYDPAGFASGSAGIPPALRDQWHRATSQAVLALGVPPLGSLGAGGAAMPEPVTPGPTTSTSSTTSTSTTSTSTSTSTTTSSTSTTSTSTSTTTTPSSGIGAAVAVSTPASGVDAATESSSPADPTSSTAAPSTRGLAATGDDASVPLASGTAAVALGAMLVAVARRRERAA